MNTTRKKRMKIVKKLTAESKRSIHDLCEIIIEHLEKKNPIEDSEKLKETLDLVFADKDERAYAYEYAHEYIKRKMNAYHSN